MHPKKNDENKTSPKNYIKAPYVNDLNIIKPFIKSLEYTVIPFSYMDERHLCDLEEDNKISKEIHASINNWKKEEGIPNGKKGFLQDVVSLLKSLDIIDNVKIEKNDLEQPLGVSGPMLNTFIEKKISATKLTKIGHDLCNLLEINNNESITKYYNLLFWRFLHSNITHNFQKLIEDNDSYQKGIAYTLKKFESDGISRTLFRDWANYFELTEIDSDKLTKKKSAKKIIISTILELNTLDRKSYPIQKLVHDIAKKLDFSHSLIDFFSVFEIILRQIQLSDEETKAIEGGEGQHGEKALPNFPRVNMLKINHEIQTQLVLNHVSESELQSVINTRD